MQKAFETGKTSATGSFKMLIGVAISTAIMAVGTVILAWFLSPDEYGLYSIALVPSLMINLFRDWGIGQALTRYIARFRAENRAEDLQGIIISGFVFEVLTGLGLLCLSVFLSGFVANSIFHRPESALLISIVSMTTFAGSLITASQASFVGFERMGLHSISLVFQSVIKTAFSIALVVLGYKVLGAVLGYSLSFMFASVASLAILYALILRKLGKKKLGLQTIMANLKVMLRYGLPLSISSILLGVAVQFYIFVMVYSCSDNALIGNYQVAVQFSVLLTFLTTPISTVLFPAFSKFDPQKEHVQLESVFTSSVKYSSLLLIPATLALMVLSQPIIGTLFRDKWVYAPYFLTLYVTTNLYAVIGSLSLGNLLSGIGETKIQMKLSILTFSIGISLALLLIPSYTIVGLIATTALASLPSLILGIGWLSKHYKMRPDFKKSSKIFVSSIISAATTYAVLYFLSTADWIRLLAGGTVFILTYLLTAPLLGAIDQDDVRNLTMMSSELGVISKLVGIPLHLVDRIARALQQ